MVNAALNRIKPGLMIAIGFLSSAMVAYQLQLMNFLSLVQWHHYAFMVISVALLAFGAGGTLLVVFRKWFFRNSDVLLPLLMIGSGLLMSVATRFSRLDLFNFDSYRLFVEEAQFINLLSNYLLFFLPFLSGALAIGLVYMIYTRHTGIYYFADLIGAGTGGPLAIFLFFNFTPEEISPLIAFLPLISGVIIIPGKRKLWLLIPVLAISANNIYLFKSDIEYNHSEYKDISKAILLPDVKVLGEKNSPFGFIAVLESPVMRYAPGLSVNYQSEVPNCLTVFNNGNWYGAILPSITGRQDHIFDHTTMGLPFVLQNYQNVLIPGSGTGNEVAHAFVNGAGKITGIEADPSLIRMMKFDFIEYNGNLFHNEKVNILNIEPRTFLSRTQDDYDLIIIPLLGSFGGSIGLQAMKEENLLTLESVSIMWEHLTDDGVIAVSSWLDYPVRFAYKIAATLAESLSVAGIQNPYDHISAVKSWGTITFCMKKNPYSTAEIDSIVKFSEEMGFEIVLLPDKVIESNTSQGTDQISSDSVIYELFGNKRDKLYSEYNFRIAPASDNKPYFSQFLKWRSFFNYRKVMAEGTSAFLEIGYMLIIVTFLQLLILSLLFILLPLFSLGWKGGKKGWVLLYFGALGMGYMLVEIVFIRYFTLYLGHPVYATAFVLTVLLIFSGSGSLVSSSIRPSSRSIFFIAFIIAFLLLLAIPGMEWFIKSGIRFRIGLRILLATGFIALPSFVMGMAFPVGLRFLNVKNQDAVPWAWGINACLSVISTALAAIIAVEGGFNLVLMIAMFCYALAGIATYINFRNQRT